MDRLQFELSDAPEGVTIQSVALTKSGADIHAFINSMKEHGIACEPVSNQGWGLLTQITLPGGGKLGVYEPRHARPKFPGAKAAKKKPAAKKKVAKKKAAPKKKARRG